jgi:predicted NBD/HSP70 family sugar kinase
VVASTTGVVRLMNERAIYDHVLQLGAVSAAQLVASTTLSKPTVLLGLANLERAGLIRQAGVRTGAAGRAPRVYEARPEAGYVLSIDLGAAWIRVVIADLTGAVVDRREVRAKVRTADGLSRQLRGLISDCLAGAKVLAGTVVHTVIAGPGSYDAEAGIVRLAPNLPGWSKPGFIQSLQPELGVSYSIENDVNMAALGELAYGNGQNSTDFVYVSIGTGIGMGIVLGGKLYRGARQAAGEISFLPTDRPEDARRRRALRAHGGLEAAAGAQAIVTAAREAGLDTASSAEEVFAAARSGNRAACRAVSAEADYVARAVGTVIAVLDPELVVIGGGIGHNVDLIIDPVRQRLADLVPLGAPPIRISALGTDAILMGGLASALDRARDLAFAGSG